MLFVLIALLASLRVVERKLKKLFYKVMGNCWPYSRNDRCLNGKSNTKLAFGVVHLRFDADEKIDEMAFSFEILVS